MREAAGCVHLSARAQIARWSPRHVKDTNTGHVARMLTVTIQFAVVKDILVFHHGRRDTRRVVEK